LDLDRFGKAIGSDDEDTLALREDAPRIGPPRERALGGQVVHLTVSTRLQPSLEDVEMRRWLRVCHTHEIEPQTSGLALYPVGKLNRVHTN
jgi:hypothetical protein